jgi:deoxyribodipyrimidine photo-lyase
MTELGLFWHRRDLRLRDNVGLAQQWQRSDRLVGVFCLDPALLDPQEVAPARVVYLLESLAELQQRYAQVGSQLLILQGSPAATLSHLAQTLGATSVAWNLDVEPYAQIRDRHVTEALQQAGIAVHTSWDHLIHAPGTIKTGSGSPYTVYTPFWRNWRSHPKPDPVPTPGAIQGLTAAEQAIAQAQTIPVPTPQALGFAWDGDLILPPGEAAAYDRLMAFCDHDQAIATYDDQRNFPAQPGTSRLSAALKLGTVGVRTLWAAADAAYQRSRSDETRQNVETWQQEIAWREFYHHALYFFPELAEGPYRDPFKDFPWDNDPNQFQAWCEGRTGYPIVDAAMRQLNETGWMHNRCRMIVASFLTKDLIINWQWGERYFMQRLIDGDLAANNGGWQWSASSGMDPKPLRIFNPASQAQKFDPEADYIRQWLPELRRVETKDLVMGTISKGDRDRCGYPAPIVDHKVQQNRFKALYKAQKG